MGPLLLAILTLHPTAPPAGPYHVDGNRILDSRGSPYLIRGTGLPPGAWTATALVTIRQRLNMNAVRIAPAGSDWIAVEDLVRVANRLELLVIIESGETASPPIRDNPNVLFAVSTPAALASLRASGLRQPVIVRGFHPADPNVIHEVAPHYADPGSWSGWDETAPLLVNGLDPGLDEASPECAAFPHDPGAAARLLEHHLASFDARHISWTISSFRPGRLITDFRYFIGAKLDDGWTCGDAGHAGLGIQLLAHLWSSDPHGLFAVHGEAGGYRLPIEGRATAYGPILADRELLPPPGPLPTLLGNVSVRITDARGVSRLAPLLYTGAGWAHITFVIPAGAAPGPAEIAIVRTDGTKSVAKAILASVAPGLLSASIDGRGTAKAWASQDGREFAAWSCPQDCSPVPIPLSRGSVTTLRFEGSGFRHAKSVRVMVGEVDAPVLSYGAMTGYPARDQLTIRLPDRLIGAGELDVLMWADGVLSNVLRVHCGARE